MNSHLSLVMAVYGSIIKDASAIWPQSSESLEKDLSYLRRAAETRGLPFFTITLPAFGKVIDRSLSKGAFLAPEVPQGIPMVKKRPKLFGDLYMKVFSDTGTLRTEIDITAVAFLRQVSYLCKKMRLQCDPRFVEETIQDFYSVEQSLPPPVPGTWDEETHPKWMALHGHPLGATWRDILYQPRDLDHTIDWSDFERFCARSLLSLGELDVWKLRPRHGPGAVAEALGDHIKYDFPNWPSKLGSFYPYDWFATGLIAGPFEYTENEPPSRLIAVPKTQKGPRLICAEPVAHQWMQQGIWGWLDAQIRKDSCYYRNSIRFRDQQYSRERALDASKDGAYATIDLSAASDRLSARLVHYMFQCRSDLLDALWACRTRRLSQDLSPNFPKEISMNKFAPMGSACTFPIQSVVFATIAAFAIRVCRRRSGEQDHSDLDSYYREVTVFGDDIIVPTYAYETLVQLLTECGLKVNTDKSFHEGFFRESCGMDAFGGIDVTPAYILDAYNGSPTSMATAIETSNNLFKRGYWYASQEVVNQLPAKERKLLAVIGEDGGFGLFSYCGRSTDHLKKIWNVDLQKEQSIALTVTAKVTKKRGRDHASLVQYFTERPDPGNPWSAGQVSRVVARKAITRVTP